MDTVEITRRTKLGWGYNAGCIQGEHGLYVPEPDSPDFVGTIKTLLRKIENCRDYQSLGGTWHTTSFFVKVAKTWRRIVKNQYIGPVDLTNSITVDGYDIDAVTVEYV